MTAIMVHRRIHTRQSKDLAGFGRQVLLVPPALLGQEGDEDRPSRTS